MRRAGRSRAALLAASAVVLVGGGGCARADSVAVDPGFTGCVVSDTAGFAAGSTGAAAWAGLQAAARAGTGMELERVESSTAADFGPGLAAMVQAGCDLTVAAGPELAAATRAAAEAHPQARFALVGDASVERPNVKPIVHATGEAAFLAGYVAAGTTRTGTVAAFGGPDGPAVAAVLDGFAAGVEHYTTVHGRDVELLGGDPVEVTGGPSGTAAVRAATEEFIDQGADVVLPVAGPASLGAVEAVAAAHETGTDVSFVWVGADGHEVLGAPGRHQLTAVLARTASSVQEVVEDASAGRFDSSPHVGTLASGGVGIAPYHARSGAVGPELAAEVEQLEADVARGAVAAVPSGPAGGGGGP